MLALLERHGHLAVYRAVTDVDGVTVATGPAWLVEDSGNTADADAARKMHDVTGHDWKRVTPWTRCKEGVVSQWQQARQG